MLVGGAAFQGVAAAHTAPHTHLSSPRVLRCLLHVSCMSLPCLFLVSCMSRLSNKTAPPTCQPARCSLVVPRLASCIKLLLLLLVGNASYQLVGATGATLVYHDDRVYCRARLLPQYHLLYQEDGRRLSCSAVRNNNDHHVGGTLPYLLRDFAVK
ncbi:hypothetical protein BJ546DRAFT_26400 [Cryomyces antarcticus]